MMAAPINFNLCVLERVGIKNQTNGKIKALELKEKQKMQPRRARCVNVISVYWIIFNKVTMGVGMIFIPRGIEGTRLLIAKMTTM